MRIGVFGGTFDPPHVGHLILAAEAYDQLALDRLLWVLTPDPPLKQGQPITPIELRKEMVLASIGDDPHFEFSSIEIERPGPQYAVDTLLKLGELYPHAELIYLVGGDSLSSLPKWHRPFAFLSACSALGVMRRPGDAIDLTDLEKILPGVTSKIRWIDAPLLEISASQIRQRAAEGRIYQYYLHPAVYRIIQTHKLYHG
jgi:nicotinate-nucleotide adenylyltransferase